MIFQYNKLRIAMLGVVAASNPVIADSYAPQNFGSVWAEELLA